MDIGKWLSENWFITMIIGAVIAIYVERIFLRGENTLVKWYSSRNLKRATARIKTLEDDIALAEDLASDPIHYSSAAWTELFGSLQLIALGLMCLTLSSAVAAVSLKYSAAIMAGFFFWLMGSNVTRARQQFFRQAAPDSFKNQALEEIAFLRKKYNLPAPSPSITPPISQSDVAAQLERLKRLTEDLGKQLADANAPQQDDQSQQQTK